jgi:hypothetical protein
MKRKDRLLAKEAAAIRRLQKRAKLAAKRCVDDVVEIGRRLKRVRDGIDHGQWLPWLKKNCRMSPDSAQRYMSVAVLIAKNRTLRNLDLSTIYLLAHKGVPEQAVANIASRVEAGEVVSPRLVRTEVAITRPTVVVPYYPKKAPEKNVVYNPPPPPIWPREVKHLIEAVVEAASADLPTPREFADGIRGGELPKIAATDLRAIAALLVAIADVLVGDMRQLPRIVTAGDEEPPLVLDNDEDDADPPRTKH